jgi:hypothetical protein
MATCQLISKLAYQDATRDCTDRVVNEFKKRPSDDVLVLRSKSVIVLRKNPVLDGVSRVFAYDNVTDVNLIETVTQFLDQEGVKDGICIVAVGKEGHKS